MLSHYIIVNGLDYGWIIFLNCCKWGRLGVDYIFELLYMGWITLLQSSQWGVFSVDYT